MTVSADLDEHGVFRIAAYLDKKNEKQVRLDFNPSNSDNVTLVKVCAAVMLEAIEQTGRDPRLTALAKTAVEEASMWAVKSATAEVV